MAFTMVPRAVLLLGTLCCASAFTLTPSLSTSTGVMTRSVMPLRMQSKGFGQGSANQKKISTVGKDRKAVSFSQAGSDERYSSLQAAQRYESIKKAGSPEFSVFFRKIGAGDEDGVIRGGWYPVGSLTCPSSQ
eukprot:311729-Rhodomonas_salina.1